MPDPTNTKSIERQTVRSACSRNLLARKAKERLQLLDLGDGVEALFPRHKK